MRSQAERQIFGYIRGKVGISLLVALVHAGVLRLTLTLTLTLTDEAEP